MADILIVEDETAINELIRRNLELVGHRCVSVYDGEEAIRRLQEGQFDLMLLDIMLPGADGFEVYQTAEHVPTIFLTAKGGLSDRVRGLRMGADDYIVKPFEMLELLARVEAVLRRTRKSGTDFVFYGVRIDFESRTIEKDGQETECTPREYELLETLVTVSYTHLDVYKRQECFCLPPSPFRRWGCVIPHPLKMPFLPRQMWFLSPL